MKPVSYCSSACAYKAAKLEKPTARRNVYLPDHVLAGVNGYVAEHRLVLFEKIGLGPHACHWCGKPINWTSKLVGTGHPGMLVADHVNCDGLDNRPENLEPACQGCNATRWHAIQPGELFVVDRNGKRRRAETMTCGTCTKTFVAALDNRRPGAPRYCSRSCARRVPRRS